MFHAAGCVQWTARFRDTVVRLAGGSGLGVRQFAGLAQDALHLAIAPAAVVEVDQHAVRRPVLPQGAHDKGPRAITLDTMTLTDLVHGLHQAAPALPVEMLALTPVSPSVEKLDQAIEYEHRPHGLAFGELGCCSIEWHDISYSLASIMCCRSG